jgi:O-antigen/teichoic acid export membrane protein
MTPLMRRIVAGMGANTYGQGVTIAIQLASLPLFLLHWDLATYGVWLMLSAFSTYFGMADVGMVSAAANRMTMAGGAGRWDEANRVFHSATAFVLAVCAVLLALAAPLVLLAPLPGLTTDDLRLALMALIGCTLLAMLGGLADALYKATGRYPVGAFGYSCIRLADWGGAIAGLMLIGTFTAVATGALLARASALAVHVWFSRPADGKLRWGLQLASWSEVRAMVRPAAWFMAMPLASSFSLQGVTLVVGQMLGPATLAVFNTYRTLARVTVQLTGILNNALGPEVSRLAGAGDLVQVRRLYARSLAIGAWMAAASGGVLYAASPWLLQYWTRGEVGFYSFAMAFFVLCAIADSLWYAPRMLLFNTNQHQRLAAWFCAVALATLGVVAAGASAFGLAGAALGVLTAEVCMAAIGIRLANRQLAHPASVTQPTPR